MSHTGYNPEQDSRFNHEHMTMLQIAIDGPVAAGKGDIAARLAQELHIAYVYTGAMYRMLALACIERRISLKEPKLILSLLNDITIDLVEPDSDSPYAYKALLDGKDVSERITRPDVAMGASDVSVIPQVRTFMVLRQQELAQGRNVVMEGRDIGLRVLPHAQLKIYLTASLEERAKRRWLQWKEKGVDKTLKEIIEDTRKRDAQDMARATDPLQKLPEAWELDTTNMPQVEVVKRIVTELNKRNLL